MSIEKTANGEELGVQEGAGMLGRWDGMATEKGSRVVPWSTGRSRRREVGEQQLCVSGGGGMGGWRVAGVGGGQVGEGLLWRH